MDERGSKISECRKSGVATTFVETDIHGFRALVQKLTGVLDMNSRRGMEMGPRKTAFKLQDRRKFQRQLEIKLGNITSHSPSPSPSPSCSSNALFQGNFLSPTAVFHSPVTPLGPDPFASRNHSPSSSFSASISLDLEGEGEFSFGDCPKREPQLLPLFPLHSTNN